MGVVAFTTDQTTVRVYYRQEYAKGDQKSNVIIERVTAERNGYAEPGNFFADGTVMVDGKQAFIWTLAYSDGGFVIYPANVEHDINKTESSIEISQQLGQQKTISVYLGENTYDNWTGFRQGFTFGMRKEPKNVVLDAIPQFKFTAPSGAGYKINVQRTSSPAGGSIGGVTSGSDIYVGDKITVIVTAQSGYAIDSMTVNGTPFTGTTQVTVDGDVNVSVSVKMQGAAYIDGVMYLPFIDNGTSFEQFIPEADTGTSWEILS